MAEVARGKSSSMDPSLRLKGLIVIVILGLGWSGQVAPVARAAACRPWRVIGSPHFGGGTLYGVSGTSSTDVWAVGQTSSAHPILEHWDGARWRAVPQPLPVGAIGDVAAIAPDDAWAMATDNSIAVIEHWDGTAWSVVPVDLPNGALLSGVTALTANDVWAGGQYGAPNGTIQPLFLHWDGAAWVRVQEGSGTDLYGAIVLDVWSQSPSDVWAVGQKGTSVYTDYVPLVEHWDGSSWSLIDAPSPQQEGANILRGVSGVASDDVWAVGTITDGWFIEHWDGISWSVNVQRSGALMFGVGGVAANDVWAVGSASLKPSLILHWDGTGWTPAPTPQAGTASTLRAVDVLAPNDIWAVGSSIHGENLALDPLIEHYTGPCGST
jgi:hypothetical protein